MATKNEELQTDLKVESVEKKKRVSTKTQSKKTVKTQNQNEKVMNDRYKAMNVDQDLPVYLL